MEKMIEGVQYGGRYGIKIEREKEGLDRFSLFSYFLDLLFSDWLFGESGNSYFFPMDG